MKYFKFLISIIFLSSTLVASPDWIAKQIQSDLEHYQQCCQNCLRSTFNKNQVPHQLCFFSIRNNTIHYQANPKITNEPISDRLWCIYRGLEATAKKYLLPDVDFVVTLHDCSSSTPCSIPLFVMAKPIGSIHILFPDFEALDGRYKVLKNMNPENDIYHPCWGKKENVLIWRGSGAQGVITLQNMHEKSRVILCRLSKSHPKLIDAGLTRVIPGFLKQYQKPNIPYEDIFKYKYQIWIDGNTASYSDSGWRLYSGCTVLKPDSDKIQWYYGDLKSGVHYIPVKADLSNLVDTILFLRDNDEYAHQVAMNSLQFAREHITHGMNLLYLHDLLWAYSKLPKVERCEQCTCH